jgi:hypothetical protein
MFLFYYYIRMETVNDGSTQYKRDFGKGWLSRDCNLFIMNVSTPFKHPIVHRAGTQHNFISSFHFCIVLGTTYNTKHGFLQEHSLMKNLTGKERSSESSRNLVAQLIRTVRAHHTFTLLKNISNKNTTCLTEMSATFMAPANFCNNLWYTPCRLACMTNIFFSMALPAHSGLWPLIQFRNHFSQTVELLG